MTKRQSIHIDGLSHRTAIPVASKIGPLLTSSVIVCFNPGTREVPDSLADQYANIFRHVGLMLEAAGGDWGHVAKMEFWTPGSDKGALDPYWIEKFPDPESRPARHTHVGASSEVRAVFTAYIPESR